MFSFLKRNHVLGIEITSSAVRAVSLTGTSAGASLAFSSAADMPAGLVSDSYASKNIQDPDHLAEILRNCLNGRLSGQRYRAGLSLPDGVFRVQTLDFDVLPAKSADQERLIRWRLEKAAAFDLADTLLRYQVLPREDAGFTVLACVAKKAVIAEYESVLDGLGVQPWSVGVSSFFTLNFYSSHMAKKCTRYAFTHLTDVSFATIIADNGGVRFYRCKDIKRGGAGDIRARLSREIDDSLHFFRHMGRSQQMGVAHLYLSGQPDILDGVSRELTAGSLAVEVLTPAAVLTSGPGAGQEMAAALGAGKTV